MEVVPRRLVPGVGSVSLRRRLPDHEIAKWTIGVVEGRTAIERDRDARLRGTGLVDEAVGARKFTH